MSEVRHRIVDARWTPEVNELRVTCRAGQFVRSFWVRADRWRVVCPHCGAEGSISTLRERWVADHRT